MDGVHAISRNELIAIMGALVGGWPETGMSEYLTVRLTGRIDRWNGVKWRMARSRCV